MRKKILSLIMSATLLASFMPVNLKAQEMDDEHLQIETEESLADEAILEAENEEGCIEDTLEVNSGLVEINKTNFPDDNFRNALIEEFDFDDKDGKFDAASVVILDLDSRNIRNLKGIEFFVNVQQLNCSYNELTSLDLSKNTKLEYLNCDYNKLTSLNLSKNTELLGLNCSVNELTSLDLSKNTKLWGLDCSLNNLTSLNLSKNTELVNLDCWGNELTSLDLSKNIELVNLVCWVNELTSLDLSKNTELASLECSFNQLTSLDLSNNTKLCELNCCCNQLTSLDLSQNTELYGLWCYDNELTSLDLSKNTELEILSCGCNKCFSVIDISKCKKLEELIISPSVTADISGLKGINRIVLYVDAVKGTVDLSSIKGIEKYMSGEGWDASTKRYTYELIVDSSEEYAYKIVSETPEIVLQFDAGYFATYQSYDFYKDVYGDVRCYDSNGNPVINEFKCDGTYTYYFQLDGTAMRNRLTYHPDGEHVIYFDEEGHEVFSNFHHVEKSIAGDAVDDLCFFDVYGYMYVDVMTYDQAGKNLYYVNPCGVIEQGRWFEFSSTCVWAGTDKKVGKGYGYANANGTLMINTYTYNWLGNYVYMQGDGHMK